MLCSFSQSKKASLPIFFKPSFNSISFNSLQFENADSSISFTPGGIFIFSKAIQSLNVAAFIISKPSGNSTFFKLEHS